MAGRAAPLTGAVAPDAVLVDELLLMGYTGFFAAGGVGRVRPLSVCDKLAGGASFDAPRLDEDWLDEGWFDEGWFDEGWFDEAAEGDLLAGAFFAGAFFSGLGIRGISCVGAASPAPDPGTELLSCVSSLTARPVPRRSEPDHAGSPSGWLSLGWASSATTSWGSSVLRAMVTTRSSPLNLTKLTPMVPRPVGLTPETRLRVT